MTVSTRMNLNATPLVSVVIPTFNHAHYLSRALQSVLDQTYTNWEVIVIDNYSVDNTDEVMSHFVAPKIIHLKNHNKGVIAVSRNVGIRAAKGEWIAFLDSDDWWTADKLQACYKCITDKVDLIYHDLEIITDLQPHKRGRIAESWQVKHPVLIDLLVRGNVIYTSSVIVRKKLLDKLNGMNESRDMVAAEDYNTWLRLAQITNGFKYVSKRLGFYQIHNQGISQKDMSAPARHASAEFIALLSQHQKNKFEANLSYTRGRFNYLAGNCIAARNDLLIAMKHGQLKLMLKSVWMISVISLLSKR